MDGTCLRLSISDLHLEHSCAAPHRECESPLQTVIPRLLAGASFGASVAVGLLVAAVNAVVELCHSTNPATAAEARRVVRSNPPLLSTVLQQHGAVIDIFVSITTLLATCRTSGVDVASVDAASHLVNSVYDAALLAAPELRAVLAVRNLIALELEWCRIWQWTVNKSVEVVTRSQPFLACVAGSAKAWSCSELVLYGLWVLHE